MPDRRRFPIRSTPTLALCALLALPLAGIAASSAPAPPQGSAAQQQTISDLRNVGTAMYSWYKSEMEPKRSEEGHKAQQKAAYAPHDLQSVPAISREELARILVPKYIQAIPEKDGWGHPYEYHLDTQDPNAESVMALRSAGADGKFSGNVYEVGGFPLTDADQDLVWIDGYFVRWPDPKK